MSDAVLNINTGQAAAMLATPVPPPSVAVTAMPPGTNPFNALADANSQIHAAHVSAAAAALAAAEEELPPVAIAGMGAIAAMNAANTEGLGPW